MTIWTMVFAGLLLGFSAFADDAADRVKLGGAWQVENPAGGQTAAMWTLLEKGDSIHVIHAEGARTIADFECNTEGKECAIKDSGKQGKVSMWFSGAKLVELETRGSEVVKRRFSISGQGEKMELEVIPIVPTGDTAKIVFKRIETAASSQAH